MAKEKQKTDSDLAAREAWREGVEWIQNGVKDPTNMHPCIVAYREMLAARVRK